MKIISKNVNALSLIELRRCKALTHGEDGLMSRRVEYEREIGSDAQAVLAFRHGRIVGWALLFFWNDQWHTYFYVNERNRGRGIGRKLAKYVIGHTPAVVAFYPESPSAEKAMAPFEGQFLHSPHPVYSLVAPSAMGVSIRINWSALIGR